MEDSQNPLEGLMENFGITKMVKRNKTEDLVKANPEFVHELRRYFQPRSELVKSLPDVNTVIDMTEVVLKDGDNYVLYKMIEGKWIGFVSIDGGGA